MNASVAADVEAMLADFEEQEADQEMFDSAWPPAPAEDPRWETMQYLLQAHLGPPDWEGPDFERIP
jgi:hypothetical protein